MCTIFTYVVRLSELAQRSKGPGKTCTVQIAEMFAFLRPDDLLAHTPFYRDTHTYGRSSRGDETQEKRSAIYFLIRYVENKCCYIYNLADIAGSSYLPCIIQRNYMICS